MPPTEKALRHAEAVPGDTTHGQPTPPSLFCMHGWIEAVSVGRRVGIRWTIGDVAHEGFEALRLAVWGAWRVFGPGAAYAVCVNSLEPEDAREQTGPLPHGVEWRASSGQLPDWVRPH
ncbi:MAG TPA: hypothetical protein VFW66_00755 [Gemmatimonadales bacterium]|nr:hypothetical protein [Gemmatimonadales bacterium]